MPRFSVGDWSAQALITAAGAEVMALVISPICLEKLACLILQAVFGRDYISYRP